MSSPVARALRIVLYAIACVALLGAPGLPVRGGNPAAFGTLGATPDFHHGPLNGLTFDDGDEPAKPAAPAASPSDTRPAVLAPLYISFAGLQILDVHSTLRAADLSGREVNPLVRTMLQSPATFIAAKAGVTAGAIFVSERLWKKNRAAAVLMMIALTSTYAAVVSHNYVVEARATGRP